MAGNRSYTRKELQLLAGLFDSAAERVSWGDDFHKVRSLACASGDLRRMLNGRPLLQSFPHEQLPLLLGPTSQLYRTLDLPPEELPFVTAVASDTVAGVVAQFRLQLES